METMKNMKPMSTKVRDTVLRIRERALFYNNTPTKQECTGDKPTFFVDFSGHCGIISVRCYPYGCKEGAENTYCGDDIRFELCESKYTSEEEILNDLNRTLSDMERYYTDWYTRQEAAPNE